MLGTSWSRFGLKSKKRGARALPTMATPNNITPEMEVEAKRHQELSNEIQEMQKGRQKQLSQLNENTMVKQELDLISGDTAVVYKKIGPCLVKQDLGSAKDWVSKRIEFVENRIKAVDAAVEAKRDLSTTSDAAARIATEAMSRQDSAKETLAFFGHSGLVECAGQSSLVLAAPPSETTRAAAAETGASRFVSMAGWVAGGTDPSASAPESAACGPVSTMSSAGN